MSITAGPFRVREIRYTGGERQATHAHEYAGVTLVLRGGFRERVLRSEEIGSALSVVVKPAGVEHSDEVSPRGAHTLQLAFDPGALASPEPEPALQTWRWLHGAPLAAEMLGILGLVRAGAPPAHIEGRIFDALGAVAADGRQAGPPPAWLQRVRERIDDEPAASLMALAAGAGVHAVSLSRAFRRYYGCGVSACRQRARLRRAAALIDSDEQQLSAIAHGAGYADHAHLCRDFRRLVGLSPSAYRTLACG